jgi:hypothetical protein
VDDKAAIFTLFMLFGAVIGGSQFSRTYLNVTYTLFQLLKFLLKQALTKTCTIAAAANIGVLRETSAGAGRVEF